MTHDGIGVGEDGPTHQNVENFATIRALPGALLFRPGDLVETSAAYTAALTGPSRPAVLCFSRQTAPNLPSSFDGALKGGYVVKPADSPKLVIIGTGTEVLLGLQAAEKLPFPVQVVSLPCQELFDEQPIAYRRAVLPKGVPVVSVEAGVSFGWGKYSHKHVGIDRFGISGPGAQVYKELGVTADNVAQVGLAVVKFFEGKPVPDLVEVP
jgi:transketolase